MRVTSAVIQEMPFAPVGSAKAPLEAAWGKGSIPD